MQAESHLGDDRERPERSHEQLGDVEPRDVLDDLASAPAHRAVGEHEARADHEVARGTETRAQRTARSGRDDAADGRSASVGWIEHQTLAESRGCGEGLLKKRERRPRPHHADEVCGLVVDDAGRCGMSRARSRSAQAASPTRASCRHHARRPPGRGPSRPTGPRRPRASSAGETTSRGMTPPTESSAPGIRTCAAPTSSVNRLNSCDVETVTAAPRVRPSRSRAAGTSRAPRRRVAGWGAPCRGCRDRLRRTRRGPAP